MIDYIYSGTGEAPILQDTLAVTPVQRVGETYYFRARYAEPLDVLPEGCIEAPEGMYQIDTDNDENPVYLGVFA